MKKDIAEFNLEINFIGKIANFFINRKAMGILLILLMFSLGITSLFILPKESLPEIVFPTITVQTSYPGASPEDVENLVSVKIEDAIKDIDGIENISSESKFGNSITTVEFKQGVDIERKKIILDNKIDSINFLPEINEPVSKIFRTSELPLMNFSISGELSIFELTSIAENIKSDLKGKKGIEEINILGGLDREIHIILDETKLLEYHLQPSDVENTLKNLNISVPIGDKEFNNINYSIRVDERFKTVNEIENILIKSPSNKQVFLNDIAKVLDTSEPIESFSRTYDESFNGESLQKSVVIEVIRKNEADVLETSQSVKDYLNNLKKKANFKDINFSISFDNAVNVENDLKSIQTSAFSGLIVVILVLFLFIGFREALIVSITIPLTLLLTLGFLNIFGITLNTFAILGLIVALGLLVDNSIIVMENIDRIKNKNIDIEKSAYIGTNQVGYPILASSSTTIAAFFPLAILPGILGAFVSTIPRTIIIAIFSSFIISISITPTLYTLLIKENISKKYDSYFFKILKIFIIIILSFYAFYNDGDSTIIAVSVTLIFAISMFFKEFIIKKGKSENILIKYYEKIMEKILKKNLNKILVLFISLIFLAGSISLLPLGILQVSFFPQNEPNSAVIKVDTPSGTTLDDTSEIINQMEKKLLLNEDIKNFNTTIGGKPVDKGVINVLFKSEDNLSKNGFNTLNNIENSLKDIPGAKIIVEGQSSGGPPVGKPIRVELVGDNLAQSSLLAEKYLKILEDIPGTYNLDKSIKKGTPQVYIDILETKAKSLGLSPTDISNQLRLSIEGVTATQIDINDNSIDVVVKMHSKQMNDISSLNSLYITKSDGVKIPLSMVANLKEEVGLSNIKRDTQKRLVFIEGDLKKGYNINQVIETFNEKRKDIIIPDSIDVNLSGDVEGIQESFLDLFQSMILAIFLVFIILTIQFDSVLQPVVILLTIPMSIIGVFSGLVLTGNDFGFYAFMGLVALVGIAVNDAIVLIDYMNFLRKEKGEMIKAIIKAGKTRFNPVLATTLTTIGGVLPLAFQEVYYAQFSYSLIFGLLITTFLTLIIIPVIYSIIESLKIKFKN
ncbi:MAG: efflux RND transporter permease subunit [Bacillota bacterium]